MSITGIFGSRIRIILWEFMEEEKMEQGPEERM
jgi:hypothetical protein